MQRVILDGMLQRNRLEAQRPQTDLGCNGARNERHALLSVLIELIYAGGRQIH
jgi:hypothetical protein